MTRSLAAGPYSPAIASACAALIRPAPRVVARIADLGQDPQGRGHLPEARLPAEDHCDALQDRAVR